MPTGLINSTQKAAALFGSRSLHDAAGPIKGMTNSRYSNSGNWYTHTTNQPCAYPPSSDAAVTLALLAIKVKAFFKPDCPAKTGDDQKRAPSHQEEGAVNQLFSIWCKRYRMTASSSRVQKLLYCLPPSPFPWISSWASAQARSFADQSDGVRAALRVR